MFTLRSLRVFLHFFASLLVFKVSAVTFINPRTSFLQSTRWKASEFGALGFRFKTFQPDVLLLYMDDRGKENFLRLDLSRGRLRLTFSRSKLGELSTNIGETLNDLNWHHVLLERCEGNATIYLGGQSRSIVTDDKMIFSMDGLMYFGGIPPSLPKTNVAQSLVGNLKRFIGCMEDIKTFDYPKRIKVRKAVMVESRGVIPGCLDVCVKESPCKNNGQCLNRFVTAECDCTGTGFRGPACNVAFPVVGLGQSDYLLFNRSNEAIATQRDRITLRFKTSKPNGLLLESGQGRDYLVIELKHGSISLKWNLGSGELQVDFGEIPCNDNKWHSIDVKRHHRRLFFAFDGELRLSKTFPGRFLSFNLKKGEGGVFVGGMAKPSFHLNSRSLGISFEGCVQEVMFNGIDIIQAFFERDKKLLAGGRPSMNCTTVKEQEYHLVGRFDKPSIIPTQEEILPSFVPSVKDGTVTPWITNRKSHKTSRTAASSGFSGDTATGCSDDEDDCDTKDTGSRKDEDGSGEDEDGSRKGEDGSGEDEDFSGSHILIAEVDVSSGSRENKIPDSVRNKSLKKANRPPLIPPEFDGEPYFTRPPCFHDDEDQCDDVDESAQHSADESSAESSSDNIGPSLSLDSNNQGSKKVLKKTKAVDKWPLVAGIIVVSVLLVAFGIFVVWWFRWQKKKLYAMYKTSVAGYLPAN